MQTATAWPPTPPPRPSQRAPQPRRPRWRGCAQQPCPAAPSCGPQCCLRVHMFKSALSWRRHRPGCLFSLKRALLNRNTRRVVGAIECGAGTHCAIGWRPTTWPQRGITRSCDGAAARVTTVCKVTAVKRAGILGRHPSGRPTLEGLAARLHNNNASIIMARSRVGADLLGEGTLPWCAGRGREGCHEGDVGGRKDAESASSPHRHPQQPADPPAGNNLPLCRCAR